MDRHLQKRFNPFSWTSSTQTTSLPKVVFEDVMYVLLKEKPIGQFDFCEDCDVRLCVYPCSKQCHTRLHYWVSEWKMTCSNGALWCATLIVYKCSSRNNSDSFQSAATVWSKILISPHQITSGLLQNIYNHIARLMSAQRSVTSCYFYCSITAFIVNKYPQAQ